MIYGILDTYKPKREFVKNIIKSLNGKTLEVKAPFPSDIDFVVLYGIMRGLEKVFIDLNKYNIPYYYIDNPYWGELGPYAQYKRIAKDNFQAIDYSIKDNKRAPNIKFKPWGSSGDQILLIPPSSKYTLEATNSYNWKEETIKKIKELTDRKINIRIKGSKVPLEQDLSKAHCIIVHSSRVGVDALIRGIPVIASKYSSCSIISSKIDSIEQEKFEEPDRQAFINYLSYRQFTIEEYCNGTAWDILNES